MSIHPSVIEQIKVQTDIVALIGSYLSLERKGDKFWGCCPFHGEKTPSFIVTPSRNAYYCFGCQKGGNAVNFLMEIEHLSFIEAMSRLATPLGISIDEGSSRQHEAEQKKRVALYELYQKVQNVFVYLLFNSSDGEKALNYIKSRAITEQTIKEFMLGYTHRDGKWLYQFLLKKKYSEEFLADSGLFSKKTADYLIFRDRLAFPIINLDAQTIAFSCRSLPGASKDSPKYINSPETAIFSKKNSLYGLHQAKDAIKKEKKFIICEGSIDVCALHQMGFKEAVAPLGSAFTEAQAKVLKRFGDEAILLFDADEAGIKATNRAAIICESQSIESRIAQIEGGKDPAEIIEKKEENILTKAIKNAKISFDFLLSEASLDLKKGDPINTERAVKALFPYIIVSSSPVRREAYLQSVALRLNLSIQSVEEEYTGFIKRDSYRSNDLSKDELVDSRKKFANKRGLTGPLYELVSAFLAIPDLYFKYKEDLKPEFINDEMIDPIINYIKENGSKSNIFTLIESNLINEEMKSYFLNKIATENIIGWEERAKRSLLRLEKFFLDGRKSAITLQIAKEEQQCDAGDSVNRLITERVTIVRRLNEIKAGL